MKKWFMIVVFFYSIICFSQDENGTNKSSKFSVGINFSPDYAFRTLKEYDPNAFTSSANGLRDDLEIPKFGFTTSANVQYHFSDKIYIELGVGYSNKGYQTDELREFVVTQTGDPLIPETAKFIYNYTYFDVPVRFNYQLGNNDLKFLLSSGITSNFFIEASSKSDITYGDGRREETISYPTEEYKNFGLSAYFGIGGAYNMSKKIQLRFQPNFQYGMLRIIDAPVTANLWNGGCNIGLYYKL